MGLVYVTNILVHFYGFHVGKYTTPSHGCDREFPGIFRSKMSSNQVILVFLATGIRGGGVSIQVGRPYLSGFKTHRIHVWYIHLHLP